MLTGYIIEGEEKDRRKIEGGRDIVWISSQGVQIFLIEDSNKKMVRILCAAPDEDDGSAQGYWKNEFAEDYPTVP